MQELFAYFEKKIVPLQPKVAKMSVIKNSVAKVRWWLLVVLHGFGE